MKKNETEISIINSKTTSKETFETGQIKTTNINILLNRVRLDKQKVLKKRIIFSLVLISLVSALAVFFID